MTYRAGLGFGLGFPGHERPPTIECDGCGIVIEIIGLPPIWFLDNKPKPGWELVRQERTDSGRIRMRSDYCPSCKAKRKAPPQPKKDPNA